MVLLPNCCSFCSGGYADGAATGASYDNAITNLRGAQHDRSFHGADALLANLRIKRQLSGGMQQPAATSSREAVKSNPPTTTSPPSSYVLFRRWIAVGSNQTTYLEITNNKGSEVITMARVGAHPQPFRLKCSAQLHPHFTSNPPLKITVNWRRKRRRSMSSEEAFREDDFSDLTESSGNEAVLQVNDNEFKDEDFRCVANVVVFSPSSNRNASYKAVRRRVLSRAIKVRYLHHVNVHISPSRQTVEEGMAARIKCNFNVSTLYSTNAAGQSPANPANISVVWLRNGGEQLGQQDASSSRGIRIFTTSDQSILHIASVTSDHSSDGYQCTVRVMNGSAESAANSLVSTLVVMPLNSSTPTELHPLPEDSDNDLQMTNTVNVRRDTEAILECLLPRSAHVNWFRIFKERGPSGIVQRNMLSNESAIIFDPKQYPEATVEPIEFQCGATDNNGVTFTYRYFVSIKEDSYFDYEEDSFTEVSKHQGQIAKLICETYPQTGEEPQMATWYKDGEVFKPFPRAKLSTVYAGSIQGMSLFLSIIEPDDQGIYECIVRNGDVERIHQTIFTVIQSTKETILDLKVSVDHSNSCFHTNFRLPGSVKLEEARLTTYFLIYYKADNSTPLNSVPFNTAKCSALPTNKKHIRCALSVCSSNYNFEPATEYVFRASMVLSQADMDVITPLSQPAYAFSFDGYASRGLDLNILYMESEEQLLIHWQPVADHQIDGIVQGYYLEILNHSASDSLFPGRKTSVSLSEKDLSYTIEKLSSKRTFSCKFRVIPITRAGRPPNNVLDSVDKFAYTIFNTDFANSPPLNQLALGGDLKALDLLRKGVAAPVITLKQQDRKPVILVEWSTTVEQSSKAELVHIRYGNNLAINQHKHLSVQHNFLDKSAFLATDNLELGLVYQVCASIQTTEKLTGFWHCSNIPLLDWNGKLLFYREQDFIEAKKLPKPIICERNNCYCQLLPDTQTIRVFWDINSTTNKQEESGLKTSKSKSQPVFSSTAFFVLHYTQNESNPTAPDLSIEFPSMIELDQEKRPRKWADVPEGRLLPGSTYRIMIEAQNADRDGVFGTYFDCHTPNELEFPAPKIADVFAADLTAVRLVWTPIQFTLQPGSEDSTPAINGYVVYWKKLGGGNENHNNQTVHSQFVKGMSTSHTLINLLEAESKYAFWMASHHKQLNRPSTFISSKVEVEIPSFVKRSQAVPDVKIQKVQRWYRRPEYHLVIIVLLLLLLLLCLITGCVWVNSWLAENKKRKKKEKLNTAKAFELELLNAIPDSSSTASTSNHSQWNAQTTNCSQPLIVAAIAATTRASIAEKREMFSKGRATPSQSNASSSCQFLLDPPVQQNLDSKGGATGCRPSGSKRFRQRLRQDPTFRKLIEQEFNQQYIQAPLIVNSSNHHSPTAIPRPVVIQVETKREEGKDDQKKEEKESESDPQKSSSLKHIPQSAGPQSSPRRRSEPSGSNSYGSSPSSNTSTCCSGKPPICSSSPASSAAGDAPCSQHLNDDEETMPRAWLPHTPLANMEHAMAHPTSCSCEHLAGLTSSCRREHVNKANNSSPTSTYKTVSSLPNLQYDSGIVYDYHLSGSNTQLTLGHNCAAHLEEQPHDTTTTLEEQEHHPDIQHMVFSSKEPDVLSRHGTLPASPLPSTPLRSASQMNGGQLGGALIINNGFSRHQERQSVN